jgi:oxygen-independent coproporphyrinogen-3 oxidase
MGMAIDHHGLGSRNPFRDGGPIPVYVHIPFCAKHCWYCDFNVYEGLGRLAGTYIEALCSDIIALAEFLERPKGAYSVYVGGGTPSIVGWKRLAALLGTIRRSFPPESGAEITVEVNPTDATAALMDGLAQAGVNRVSLGVQSFDNDRLAELDRLHEADRSAIAVDLALKAGVGSVSIDLLYGIPNQSPDDWVGEVEKAIALQPDHISAYALTLYGEVAENRATASGGAQTGDGLAVYYGLAVEMLRKAGYGHYEVSNWARSGQRSRHNGAIWRGSEYLGFGCGAHATVGHRRYSTLNQPAAYIEAIRDRGLLVGWEEQLSEADLLIELIAGAVRTSEGLDLAGVRERFAYDLASDRRADLEPLRKAGYVEVESGWLRLTDAGLLLADGIAARLLPDK